MASRFVRVLFLLLQEKQRTHSVRHKMNVFEHLISLPQTTLDALYSDPWTVQAVFRWVAFVFLCRNCGINCPVQIVAAPGQKLCASPLIQRCGRARGFNPSMGEAPRPITTQSSHEGRLFYSIIIILSKNSGCWSSKYSQRRREKIS